MTVWHRYDCTSDLTQDVRLIVRAFRRDTRKYVRLLRWDGSTTMILGYTYDYVELTFVPTNDHCTQEVRLILELYVFTIIGQT